ncbi:MAG: peptidylprolyl isomerase [Gemmatimonadota bacterium]
MNRSIVLVAGVAGAALGVGCDALDGALTAHSRPAAEAAGVRLTADELGSIMAMGPIPDTALNAHWATQIATLWADYVRLATLYAAPDTTLTLDYDPLLEGQRYFDALAVQRYRDSVVLRGLEPSDDEVREYFETRQPFTRLDVRRIRLSVPEGADEAVRDSLFQTAAQIQQELEAGADFLAVARERSDEPLAARGQLLAYQGHEHFPPAADSVVYRLEPGQVTPAISTEDGIFLFRVERRIEPDFEMARDRTYRKILEERRTERALLVADTLIGNARPSVLRGAVPTARRIAEDPAMAVGRVSPGSRLVEYRDGELTVQELRLLFQVRNDIRETFAEGSEEDIEFYLHELARDEIMVAAARRNGLGPTEEERQKLREAIASQVAAIARRLGLSHNLVRMPAYDVKVESLAFLEETVRRGHSLPWLGEFRPLLDPDYPARVHERGAAAAAKIAASQRAESSATAEPRDAGTHGPTESVSEAGSPPPETPTETEDPAAGH